MGIGYRGAGKVGGRRMGKRRSGVEKGAGGGDGFGTWGRWVRIGVWGPGGVPECCL